MTANEIVKVDLGARSYDIIIGSDLLCSAGQYIKEAAPSGNYIIVTDKNIPGAYVNTFMQSIKDSLPEAVINLITLPAGEKTKSFTHLEALLDQAFAFEPDRKTVLIALGGGVIGDLTGFAASILLRGVRFVQIPTTLLSQVDSSVGGKTGINNKFGKNLIGSFYQPSLVLTDISTLESLPKREFLAGYAEVVKYGLINNRKFFEWLDNNLGLILKQDEDALKYIIATSCRAKAAIVTQDEKEGGVRALLNLGHTFGHALEQQTGYGNKLVHGEAVSIGMVFAFLLSQHMGLCKREDTEKVTEHLSKAGLPVSPLAISKKWDAEELLEAMRHDKKADGGKLVFILAKAIGDTFIKKGIEAEIIRDTITSVISNS